MVARQRKSKMGDADDYSAELRWSVAGCPAEKTDPVTSAPNVHFIPDHIRHSRAGGIQEEWEWWHGSAKSKMGDADDYSAALGCLAAEAPAKEPLQELPRIARLHFGDVLSACAHQPQALFLLTRDPPESRRVPVPPDDDRARLHVHRRLTSSDTPRARPARSRASTATSACGK